MTSRTPRIAAALAGPAILSLTLLACGSDSTNGPPPAATTANAAASASPTATATAASTVNAVVGIPVDREAVGKVVNPKNLPPYSGPTGTLRGVIHITGDPPPELKVKLPEGPCRGEAAATHGKLFRVGQGGTLADALVAVTGYNAYVPPKGEAEKLTIHGCSLSRRTVVATFGQRIEVANLEKIDSYMPYLDGAPVKAILVAIPGGDAVRLYPPQTGRYVLRDQLPNEHLTANVYVLAYATTAVTALDGTYEITGIPVGPVEVNAMLPATNKAVGQRMEIKEGLNTLDLTLTFDAKKDTPQDTPTTAAPSTTPSAKAPGPKG